ncbi:endolytic transglycosylase MltG [Clostridium sp.]|uniref:endolytic transglycosylase MltG n=1 Tax=Clostridium sp. TaxID=1506 RepID=UPI003216CFF7
MKKVIGIIVIALALILVSGGGYYRYATKSPLKGEEVTVAVNEGDSLYNVFNTLDSQGVVKNKTLSKVFIKLNNISAKLVPGTFKVPGGATMEEIVSILENGSNEDAVVVTIPEGFNIESIAALFDEKGLFTKDEFIGAINDYPVPDYIPKSEDRRYDLEGFLFPDTYSFVKGVKPAEVISTMNNAFYKEISSIVKNDSDIYKVATIASIIEGETRVDSERSTVSSVIYNRLEKEMKLQIDATVIYALGKHVDTVLYKHLEIDSPYNTYKNYGLPVGPICSSGLASISAAINPENTNYLFYVLIKGTDNHYFTDNDVDFLNKQKELGY